jgi:hypothetical protein
MMIPRDDLSDFIPGRLFSGGRSPNSGLMFGEKNCYYFLRGALQIVE